MLNIAADFRRFCLPLRPPSKKYEKDRQRNTGHRPAGHRVEHHGAAAGTGRRSHRRPSGRRRLHRRHCRGRHAFQYHLLDFRVLAHGYQRNDRPAVRKTEFNRNCSDAGTGSGYRRQHRLDTHRSTGSHPRGGLPNHPAYRSRRPPGYNLLPHLHLGSSGHAGPLRTDRLVHRHAELTHPDADSHYTERGEHCGQPLPGLSVRYEGRGSGTGHPHRPICRPADGYRAVDAPLRLPAGPLPQGRAVPPVGYETLLRSEPRHLPAYPLSGGSHPLFHIGRSRKGKSSWPSIPC